VECGDEGDPRGTREAADAWRIGIGLERRRRRIPGGSGSARNALAPGGVRWPATRQISDHRRSPGAPSMAIYAADPPGRRFRRFSSLPPLCISRGDAPRNRCGCPEWPPERRGTRSRTALGGTPLAPLAQADGIGAERARSSRSSLASYAEALRCADRSAPAIDGHLVGDPPLDGGRGFPPPSPRRDPHRTRRKGFFSPLWV